MKSKKTKGVTVADVLRIFAGAKVVSLADEREILAERARWTRDTAGVWHRTAEEKESSATCTHCVGDHVPLWRRGGKLIPISMDGATRWQCHYCGRVAEPDDAR